MPAPAQVHHHDLQIPVPEARSAYHAACYACGVLLARYPQHPRPKDGDIYLIVLEDGREYQVEHSAMMAWAHRQALRSAG